MLSGHHPHQQKSHYTWERMKYNHIILCKLHLLLCQNVEILQAHIVLLIEETPVSYTHLDVYKRQLIYLLRTDFLFSERYDKLCELVHIH